MNRESFYRWGWIVIIPSVTAFALGFMMGRDSGYRVGRIDGLKECRVVIGLFDESIPALVRDRSNDKIAETLHSGYQSWMQLIDGKIEQDK